MTQPNSRPPVARRRLAWTPHLDSGSGGRKVGRFEAVSVAVDRRYQGISHRFTLVFADGSIEVSGAGSARPIPGLPHPDDQQLSIVGGTGAYSGASGSYHMRYSNDLVTHITLRLN